MTDKIICEKCGSEMIPIDPNKPVGMTCPNCGWGWATTYSDPIFDDSTVYEIILLDDNQESADNLKAIAKITNTNVINAKKLLYNLPSCIFSGKAVEISALVRLLDEKSLKYKIEPEFPY